MKLNRENTLWALLVLAIVLAAFALAGHPLVPPEALAGLGMVPLGAGVTIDDVADIIEKQNDAFQKWRDARDAEMAEVREELKQIQIKANRPKIGSDPENIGAPFAVRINGEVRPVLLKSQRAAEHWRGNDGGSSDFDVGQFVRDSMLGRKAASGPALVPTGLSLNIIDDVRAATTFVQAGAVTIPIDGPTKMARIEGDPTVYDHGEGINDVSESDITATAVTLNPRTLAALVPLTMELVEDSTNLSAALTTSITAAFAAKLDALALATVLADTAIPTSASGEDPNSWVSCLTAVGSAIAADQPLPTGMICNTADFIARAAELSSAGAPWLGKPPVLQSLLELPTTGIAAGTAVWGGFARGTAVAMRRELSLDVVRYGKPGSVTHLLVATMRAGGLVLQPKALYIQKKTVV